MSGICSVHQGHDTNCPLCMATPPTQEEMWYWRGWEESRAAQLRNCWTPVENCVLNVYTQLEDAARAFISDPMDKADLLEKALAEIDKLRELNRGVWNRDLKQ